MTVTSETSSVSYAGDGSSTAFAVPFYFLEDGDLLVIERSSAGVETTKVLNTDYSVSGAGVLTGGTITILTTPPAVDTELHIIRNVEATQEVDYQEGGASPAETLERALDKLTMLEIQALRKIARSLVLADTDTDGSGYYDAGGNTITGLGTPSATSDAATKGYVDALLAGGELPETISGNVDMNSFTLQNMADADAAGKPIGYGQIGDGLEWNAGKVCAKLADTSLLRSSSGLSVNPSALSMFTTGDVKATLKATADSGWVMMDDGTIGDASSSATTRANADTEDLFTLLWTNCADAQCAVSGGRGATAAADFAAHKRIAIPKGLGRALAFAGAGSGLTSRALAETAGAETTAVVAAHTHTFTTDSDGAHTHGVPASSSAGTDGIRTLGANDAPITSASGGAHTHTGTTASTGSASPIVQPTLFLNFMIKL